ncbi:MAG TPA: hypothetical protein DCW68_00545 [Rhodospirillaceae bacterium]|nr:hypothetical protein [Rhodospirillaceae bacterium]
MVAGLALCCGMAHAAENTPFMFIKRLSGSLLRVGSGYSRGVNFQRPSPARICESQGCCLHG